MLSLKIDRSTFIVLIITAILSISMSASAFEMGKRGPGKKDGFLKALNTIDLSDDQKEAIEAIREQTEDSITPLKDEIKSTELLSAVLAENINTEEVNLKIEQINELRSDIGIIKMNAKLEAAKELTADQRLELLTLIENMQKKREKRNQWENMFQWKNMF